MSVTHEQLRELAELAVTACLPILPLRGSWGSGYEVERTIHRTLHALPGTPETHFRLHWYGAIAHLRTLLPDPGPDEVLVRMADGWVASMRRVQTDLLALEVPRRLTDAAVRVERALHVYVRLAERLRAAAGAQGDERDLLIDEAVLLGQEADRLYDEALTMLVEVRS